MLGMFVKTHGHEAVIEALRRCASEQPIEPVAWLQGAFRASTPSRVPRETDYQRRQRERIAEACPALAHANGNGVDLAQAFAAPSSQGGNLFGITETIDSEFARISR
jgi:hypothetical protein